MNSLAVFRLASTNTAAYIASRAQARNLSSHGVVAVEKLRNVLEEYRSTKWVPIQVNVFHDGYLSGFFQLFLTSYLYFIHFSYTREIPSRFRKDIIQAAKSNETDRIALDGMQRVLSNINMQHKLSECEMKTIFRELGNDGEIPVDRMLRII